MPTKTSPRQSTRAPQTDTTTYEFKVIDERRIAECFEIGGSEGLRRLMEAALRDAAALGQLADEIDDGACYDVGAGPICAWWGWG